MGFGFLLYGFLMMLDLNIKYRVGIDVFPDIVGYVFFYLATRKLAPYSIGFRNAKYMTFPMMLLGIITIGAELFSITGIGMNLLSLIVKYAYYTKDIFLMVFCALLFYGIYELAKEVSLSKIAHRAIAAFVIYLFYIVLTTAVRCIDFSDAQKAFLNLLYSLIWYIFVFFSVFVSFNCYMYICYEGEEDPVVKPGKLEVFIKNLKNKNR